MYQLKACARCRGDLYLDQSCDESGRPVREWACLQCSWREGSPVEAQPRVTTGRLLGEAKVTRDAQVREAVRDTGVHQAARRFGIDPKTVYHILKEERRAWGRLPTHPNGGIPRPRGTFRLLEARRCGRHEMSVPGRGHGR